MRAFDAGLDFVEGGRQAHVDLPRLLAVGGRVQLFAVFASRSYYPDRDLRAYAEEAIATIHSWAEASAGRLRLALTRADIRGARQQIATDKRMLPSVYPFSSVAYALIGLEGADPLGDQVENLEHFYRLGVRNVIPAWDDNTFSGTSAGPGDGLTAEGRKLIELCETLRVMVDVSHLSDAAFWQVCQIARRPFIASHSNCRGLCPSPRNLTDEQICTLAARGGVMGINLAPDFLEPRYLAAWDAALAAATASLGSPSLGGVGGAGPTARQKIRQVAGEQWRAIPLPGIEWIGHHVRHAIQVGGEDCVGLGGDLDGISFMPAGMTGVESYPLIPEALLAAGLTEAQVEKVCWRNMARVFGEVLS
jgi:membrane dipeptidase